MKNIETAIVAELTKRLIASNFEEIVITMKVNSDNIHIIPCCYTEDKSVENCEYFLLRSEVVNLCGADTLAQIAHTIAHYQDELDWSDKALLSLKEHICKYGEKSDWDWVSDYHKDIFGHRPHVPTETIIAWAHSNSTNSARFF